MLLLRRRRPGSTYHCPACPLVFLLLSSGSCRVARELAERERRGHAWQCAPLPWLCLLPLYVPWTEPVRSPSLLSLSRSLQQLERELGRLVKLVLPRELTSSKHELHAADCKQRFQLLSPRYAMRRSCMAQPLQLLGFSHCVAVDGRASSPHSFTISFGKLAVQDNAGRAASATLAALPSCIGAGHPNQTRLA